MVSPTHIVVVPFPAQGHINPALDLSRALATAASVSITFVSTELCVSQILAQGFSAGEVRIRLVGLPGGLPSGKGIVDKEDQIQVMIDAAEQMEKSFESLLVSLIENAEEKQSERPACVIYDFGVWWVGGVSRKLSVPGYIFCPLCAGFFSFLIHFPDLVSQGRLPFRSASDAATSNLFDLPGFPSLHASELPDLMCDHETALRGTSAFGDATGVLINTIYELEKDIIEGMRQGPKALNVRAVGPILPPSFLNRDVSAESREQLSAADRECLKWLDLQPTASVLYVAFGTIASISAEQIHELAMGLEASGHRFLWVVRLISDDGLEAESVLPKGFEERVKERGKVIRDWAPQRSVLRHKATGGFMTHGGWNSILESLCMGIPLLCWAMFGDQVLNCKLLEVLELGKAMRKPGETSLVGRKEVSDFVRQLMDEKNSSGKHLRMNASLVKQAASRAILPGGSSYDAIHSFLNNIVPQPKVI